MGNNFITKYMRMKDPATEKEHQTKCKKKKDKKTKWLGFS